MTITKKINNVEKEEIDNFMKDHKGKDLYALHIIGDKKEGFHAYGVYFGNSSSEMLVQPYPKADEDNDLMLGVCTEVIGIQDLYKDYIMMNEKGFFVFLKASSNNTQKFEYLVLSSPNATVVSRVGKGHPLACEYHLQINELDLYFYKPQVNSLNVQLHKVPTKEVA